MSMVKSQTAFVDNQAGLPFLQNRASLWLEIKPRVKWKRNLNSLTNLIIPKILQNKAMLKSFLKTLLTFVKNSEIICFFWTEVTEFFKNASRILIRKTSAISAISLDVTKHDVWKKYWILKTSTGTIYYCYHPLAPAILGQSITVSTRNSKVLNTPLHTKSLLLKYLLV